MKIAILDFDNIRNPLLNAGQARTTYEVGKRLVERGHLVEVITSRFPNSNDRIEKGMKYHHIGLGTKNIKLNNLVYILAVPLALRNIDADIIIECFTAPISTLMSPLFTKIPVVALPSMFNAKEFSKKYHLPFHWIERFGMRFYKYIMPFSEIDYRKAKLLNPNTICKKIPPGVGEEYFSIKHKKPKHILFLGRLDMAQKGIDLLLEAYAKVKEKIKYPLIIAGHGPDEGKIKKIIQSLKLENKVTLVGATYGKKKMNLISETIFVAFPSRHDIFSHWSLEVLASGFPLVSFDLSEFNWLKNGLVLKAKPFNTTEYSSLLLKATKKKFLKKADISSRKFASSFTWEKVVLNLKPFSIRF